MATRKIEIEELDISLVHVDGTQDEEAMLDPQGWRSFYTSKVRQQESWRGKILRIILRCLCIGIEIRTSNHMCRMQIGGMWM
jgi:hypothetical protein